MVVNRVGTSGRDLLPVTGIAISWRRRRAVFYIDQIEKVPESLVDEVREPVVELS